MINFKHSSKRGIRRDLNDDLSIVTGGRPIIRVGGQASSKSLKRVRNYNEKLRKDFVKSRENAHFKIPKRLPTTSSAIHNDTQFYLQSPYFRNNISANYFTSSPSPLKLPVGSSTSNQQTQNLRESPFSKNGECTISSLPELLKTSQSKQAVLSSQKQLPRGILRSTATNLQNSIYGHHHGAESSSQYWTLYANTGRAQKTKLATPVSSSMSMKCKGNKSSSWKICSSRPMTRMDASLVQMQMASAISGVSSESIAGSSFYSPYSSANQTSWDHHNQQGITAMLAPPPRQAVPFSLLKSVVPPPSPLIPTTPDTNSILSNRSSNFNSCGVHQGEWMDRSKCVSTISTKQYSIEQIADILCGFATPDSIMAAQLFQPFPSAQNATPMNFTDAQSPCAATATSTFNQYPSDQSNPYQADVFQTARTNSENTLDNDGETSIYFKNTAKKKTVSFLTDNMDNICVTEHLFDPFSQDLSRSASSGNSSFADKENINPDMLNNTMNGNEIVYPTPKSLVPLFELDGSNAVGLVHTGGNDSQNQNSSFSDGMFSFDLNNSNIPDSGSCLTSRDLEKIHPSWDSFLNDICSSECPKS